MKTTAVAIHSSKVETIPSLFGDLDKNLRLIEDIYGVHLSARGSKVQIEGDEKSVTRVERLFSQLSDMISQGVITHKEDVSSAIRAFSAAPAASLKEIFQETIPVSQPEAPGCGQERDPAESTSRPSRRTTSCSASDRPGPARPILPWPWQSRRSSGAK